MLRPPPIHHSRGWGDVMCLSCKLKKKKSMSFYYWTCHWGGILFVFLVWNFPKMFLFFFCSWHDFPLKVSGHKHRLHHPHLSCRLPTYQWCNKKGPYMRSRSRVIAKSCSAAPAGFIWLTSNDRSDLWEYISPPDDHGSFMTSRWRIINSWMDRHGQQLTKSFSGLVFFIMSGVEA